MGANETKHCYSQDELQTANCLLQTVLESTDGNEQSGSGNDNIKVVERWLRELTAKHGASPEAVSVEITDNGFIKGLLSRRCIIVKASWSHDAGHTATIFHTLTAVVDEKKRKARTVVLETREGY
eukprot:TRINITY_DN12254_c0_g1_i1.p1 TRINITY_DN12254_c0_g1~~TRINITY_DN12254_c0_g1_i1.p1  ORF type:complete len:125 (+),score=24.40 TRINITY_DN12254_c0_g1_i1:203-577(+)